MNYPDDFIDKVICGDCLEVMKDIPDNAVDLVLTDPPYGYSFMGKDWDKAVIPAPYWRECLRVLKAGAFCFVMSAPRQDVLSRVIVNLENAGFRTDFTSIYWTYASGFPKAGNIGKMVDKRLGAEREVVGYKKHLNHLERGDSNIEEQKHLMKTAGLQGTIGTGEINMVTTPATPQAKALDGSYAGFQPKPAVEVIIVCMKPLSEKTFVDQAMKNRKGITWLDDCRIPFNKETESNVRWNESRKGDAKAIWGNAKEVGREATLQHPHGRFPANLLVSDDVLNDARNSKGSHNQKFLTEKDSIFGMSETTYRKEVLGYGDSGSFSRYFDLDKWFCKTFPFLIVPKASKREKNKGLEKWENHEKPYAQYRKNYATTKGHDTPYAGTGRTGKNLKNYHPTVKPIKLMSYLITLGSRRGDIVLDPFVGSGTTAIACELLNRHYIAIDTIEDYCKIARERLMGVPDSLFKGVK